MTRSDARPTALFRLYVAAAWGLFPFAYHTVARKLRDHDMPPERAHEKAGHATLPRPDGTLVWFHAASVGESLSVLTLITRMGQRLPDARFLITSGTSTSARIVASRMPPRTRHQFAALDAPGPVARFLAHWRPQAAIFVESELWPLTLVRARDSGARLALLNARLSDKSVAGWRKWPDTARFVLDQFSLLITQNRKAADNLLSMGADPDRVESGSNLKSLSAPLPVDQPVLDAFTTALNGRPAWVASSTHPGEEQIVLEAHRRLLEHRSDLCLVLIPRHPERADAVAALIADAGLSFARRSKGEQMAAQQVYLADTLGETGTWYAAAPIVFMAGSLAPIGGHNPIEPAQAGAAILTGPHVTNFTETYAPLIACGGAMETGDAKALALAVDHLLSNPAALATARQAARAYVSAQEHALDALVDRLCTALDLDHA